MSFVKFEHGDIEIKFASDFDVGEDSGNHATHEIATRLISKNFKSLLFEQLADDFGSGGFAIGARNYDNAVRKFAENLFDEIFVGTLDDETWQSGATVAFEASDFLNGFAENNAYFFHDFLGAVKSFLKFTFGV